MNDKIRMGFFTLKELFDGKQWLEILRGAEAMWGARLARLDVNDPVRRKVDRLEEAAEYVCQFGEKEDSRWLHGKFDVSKVEISISLFRRTSRFPNGLDFYFPTKMADAEAGRLWEVFSEVVRLLEPFYAFCDLQSVIAGKRKAMRNSVNLEAELFGVFWFTHFNRKWVDFIGATRFDALSCEKTVGPGGATLRLGASLTGLGSEREASETLLGNRFFVDPELRVDKRPGENALTFSQLRG
jgi:hypothetical protein